VDLLPAEYLIAYSAGMIQRVTLSPGVNVVEALLCSHPEVQLLFVSFFDGNPLPWSESRSHRRRAVTVPDTDPSNYTDFFPE
jgi:hypothetical protein